MSFITNAFKGQGSGYAQAQNAGQGQVADDALSVLKGLFPGIQSAYNTAAAYEPQRQAQLAQLMKLNSPGNQAAIEAAYANQAYGNAARAGRQASAMNAAAGGSPALDMGNQTAIADNANQAANAFNAQMNSPEHQMQLGNNELALYGQAQQSPLMNDFAQMAQTIYGQPKVTVQPGLGQFLGQLAGTAASMYGGGGGEAGAAEEG